MLTCAHCPTDTVAIALPEKMSHPDDPVAKYKTKLVVPVGLNIANGPLVTSLALCAKITDWPDDEDKLIQNSIVKFDEPSSKFAESGTLK
jgi:hypothetical protein